MSPIFIAHCLLVLPLLLIMSLVVLTSQALGIKATEGNATYRQGTSGLALVTFLDNVLKQLGKGAEFYDLGASAGYLIFVLRLMGHRDVGGCEIIGESVKDGNKLGRRHFKNWAPVQHASLCSVRFTTKRLRVLFCNNLVFPDDPECFPWLLRSLERMMIEQSLACSVAVTAAKTVGCQRQTLEEPLESPTRALEL